MDIIGLEQPITGPFVSRWDFKYTNTQIPALENAILLLQSPKNTTTRLRLKCVT